MSARSSLIDRVEEWLHSQEWRVNDGVVAERGQFLLAPSDGEAPWPVIATAEDHETRVLFYSVWPDDIAAEHREAVATLATRINYGLLVGAVELDLDDGELRVRTDIDMGTADLDDDALGALMARALSGNLTLSELVWKAVDSVIDDGTDPAEAARALEG